MVLHWKTCIHIILNDAYNFFSLENLCYHRGFKLDYHVKDSISAKNRMPISKGIKTVIIKYKLYKKEAV